MLVNTVNTVIVIPIGIASTTVHLTGFTGTLVFCHLALSESLQLFEQDGDVILAGYLASYNI